MAETYGDWVAITNSSTADTESSQSSIAVSVGARITKIIVCSLAGGNTYAVRIDCPSISSPQKYVVPCNGAAANVNGSKVSPAYKEIDCDIPLPAGASTVYVSTWADVASATCKVGLVWEA